MAAFVVRAVVGGEHHQGVLGEAVPVEGGDDLPDVVVDEGDVPREALLGIGPVLPGELPVVGFPVRPERHLHPARWHPSALVVGVRDVEGVVEEEGRRGARLFPEVGKDLLLQLVRGLAN